MRNWILSLALVVLPSGALADEWYEEDYNPVPMDDDVILPMPCDGWMVFRKVETNLINGVEGGAYADRSIRLGWDGARDSAFREGEWKSFVAGGLIDDESRYYLISKYELTEDQMVALVDPDCDFSDVDYGAPFAGLTWFDAIKVSHLYSVWLHSNAADVLPVSVGTTAYVRPPTEAEWEFATRGGLQVSDSERRNERFPMDGPMSDFAFFSGDGVSNGDLQYVGKKRPNPLGLFDVYGNAFEIVFDPFRLNKAGRMHGHFGAMTIKGGSIRSGSQEIRSGTRQEVPLYSSQVAGSIARRPDVGLRVVISGVSTGDQQHSDILASSWDRLVEASSVDTNLPPVQLLRSLADESEDIALRNKLNSIAVDIESNLRERDELQVEALENLLQSGTLMIYRIRGLREAIENLRQLQVHEFDRSSELLPSEPNGGDGETDDEKRERLRLLALYDNTIAEFGRFAEIYADTFLQLVQNYPREQVLDVARNLIPKLRLQERDQLANHLSILGRRIADYDDNAGWDRSDQILGMLHYADRSNEPPGQRLNVPMMETPPWFDGAVNQN